MLVRHNNQVNESIIKSQPISAVCNINCDPILQITDSINIPSSVVTSALSPDGSRVFLFYNTTIGTTSTSPVTASLFQNVNGKLVKTIDIPVPENFPQSSTAAVSPDFTKLAIVYETDEGGNGIINIYDLNNLPDVIKTIALPPNFQPFTTNTNFNLGISSDNELFTLSFLTTGPPKNQGVFQVYNIITGNLVSSSPIGGFSNGPAFFDLCREVSKKCKCKHESRYIRRFISISWATTDYPSFPPAGCGIKTTSPAYLEIYELKQSSLIITTRNLLSGPAQNIAIPTGIYCSDEKLIAISTSGRVSTQPRITTFVNPDSLSFEQGGINIYKFNGKNIYRVAFQPVFGPASAINFYPNGKYISVAFSSSTQGLPTYTPRCASFRVPGYFQVFRVCSTPITDKVDRKINTQDSNVCIYPIDIPRFTSGGVINLPFSNNGRWLVVSGGTLLENVVQELPDGPYNNVQLYYLTSSGN